MIKKQTWITPIVLLLLWMGNGAHLCANDSPGTLMPARLTVAFTEKAFHGIKQEDAEIAFKAFTKTIGLNSGFDVSVTVKTFAGIDEVLRLPEGKRPELVILDSLTFLEMEETQWLDQLFVTAQQGQVAKSYLLLTRQDSQLKTLGDLRGKSLNLCVTNNAKLGDRWLSSLLKEGGSESPAEFFAEIGLHNKPMPALLPVFFNKTDAALIDDMKFKLMAELNPQLHKMHTVIASEPFVESVICANGSGWSSQKFRESTLKSMVDLHLSLQGQQVLTLFKVDQIVPYESEYLTSVRKLKRRLASP